VGHVDPIVHATVREVGRERHGVGLGRGRDAEVPRILLRGQPERVHRAVVAPREEAAQRHTTVPGVRDVHHRQLVTLGAGGDEEPGARAVGGGQASEARDVHEVCGGGGQLGELNRAPLVRAAVGRKCDGLPGRGQRTPSVGLRGADLGEVDGREPPHVEAAVEVGVCHVEPPQASIGRRDDRDAGRVVEAGLHGRTRLEVLVARDREEQERSEGEAHQKGAHPRDPRPGVARTSGENANSGVAGVLPPWPPKKRSQRRGVGSAFPPVARQ